MPDTAALARALAAVAPVHGVSVGRWDNKATWRVDFKDEATAAQRQAAADLVAAYVEDTPTIKTWEAGNGLGTPLNRTIFDALWQMRQAAGTAGMLPVITKSAYATELKAILASYL